MNENKANQNRSLIAWMHVVLVDMHCIMINGFASIDKAEKNGLMIQGLRFSCPWMIKWLRFVHFS